MSSTESLQSLGWRNYFQQQLEPPTDLRPARVMSVHRGRVEVAGEFGVEVAESGDRESLSVGDWIMLDAKFAVVRRRLQPFAVFRRRAAGSAGQLQIIAANVDTLFIVTSANRDFNVARLERYLAIAHEAAAFPVVVITKTDLVENPGEFANAARALSPGLLVEMLDARDADETAALRSWCAEGQTVALLGSSGVGKSTLINTLTGAAQHTRSVRSDDQRGRHTTTARSMHRLRDGGWLIDTPGMRELQLVDVGDALEDVFHEISERGQHCRFADCDHESEPGCAVRAAIEAGDIDEDRLRRYRKLQAEDRRNSESMAQRRSRDKSLSRFYKAVQSDQRRRKGR